MRQTDTSADKPLLVEQEVAIHSVAGVPTNRRWLLKVLGRGSAALAASAPITKTLAGTASVTPGGLICSISGVQSGAHSQSTSLPTCGGYSPGRYKKLTHWPGYPATSYTVICTRGSISFDQNTLFSAVFGGGLQKALIDVMKNYPSSDEFHWIPALLNALSAPPSYVFPYTAGEVLDLYSSAQSASALSFFKNYMEKV